MLAAYDSHLGLETKQCPGHSDTSAHDNTLRWSTCGGKEPSIVLHSTQLWGMLGGHPKNRPTPDNDTLIATAGNVLSIFKGIQSLKQARYMLGVSSLKHENFKFKAILGYCTFPCSSIDSKSPSHHGAKHKSGMAVHTGNFGLQKPEMMAAHWGQTSRGYTGRLW